MVVKCGKVPMSSISQYAKPVFTVIEEPNLAQPSMTSQRRQPRQSIVITTRKKKAEDQGAVRVHCPVAPCESAGPAKRHIYYKDKVYQGTTKFSFEEFMAIRWKNNQRVRVEAESLNREKGEVVEMELSKQLEALPKKMAEFERIEGGSDTLVMRTTGQTIPCSSSQ